VTSVLDSDAAALHGKGGRADRGGAVRRRRIRLGSRQRARPGVPPRRPGRGRRPQDLERRGGPCGARPRDAAIAHVVAVDPDLPVARQLLRGRRSTGTTAAVRADARPQGRARASTTLLYATSRSSRHGSVSRSGRSSIPPRAGSCCGTSGPRRASGRCSTRSRIGKSGRSSRARSPGSRSACCQSGRACDRRSCTATSTSTTCLLDEHDRVAGSSTSATAATARSRPTSPCCWRRCCCAAGRGADAFRVARIALDGFASRLPLEPLELELIGDLVSARVAAIVSISAWRGRRFPENAAYIEAWTTTRGSYWSCSTGSIRRRWPASSAARGSPSPPGSSRASASGSLGALLTPLTYARPVHAVRAEGVWIHEADGSRLLDAYNNVPVVGHCHPRVTEAVVRQTRLSAVNARYLAEPLVELAERLLATFLGRRGSRHGAARQLRQRGERPRVAARRRRDGPRRGARDRERVPRRHRVGDRALARGLAVGEPPFRSRAHPTTRQRRGSR